MQEVLDALDSGLSSSSKDATVGRAVRQDLLELLRRLGVLASAIGVLPSMLARGSPGRFGWAASTAAPARRRSS